LYICNGKEVDMESLLVKSNRKLSGVNGGIERYLLNRINWETRMISIQGARGSGKTTVLLQQGKKMLQQGRKVLYASMDDLFFLSNNLIELAEKFEQIGGEILLLDEVHKYPNWSREIKLIYDDLPNLKVVFTSSSILEVYKSESDLSRRVVNYDLNELSLREFIQLKSGIELPKFTLTEILENHVSIASEIVSKVKPIYYFEEYLKYGAYPYFKEGETEDYYQKLRNTINLIIDVDVNAIENLDYSLLVKLKKLIYMISINVPFTVNVSKMSEIIGVSRPTLLHALFLLEKARIIALVNKPNKGIGILTKPEKIYLNNTNIANALTDGVSDVGTSRETFFVNQLKGLHQVNLSESADFLIDQKYTFEIGGKNKNKKQIAGLENAYIAKDSIEFGTGNVIPLYLFGLMY
jgi:predicted AAA+ superfamily ATPase